MAFVHGNGGPHPRSFIIFSLGIRTAAKGAHQFDPMRLDEQRRPGAGVVRHPDCRLPGLQASR